MGKTILCQHCKSTFNEDLLKDREQPDLCPVCGKSLVEDGEASPPPPEKKKWYYYKEGGGGWTIHYLVDLYRSTLLKP